MVCLFSILHGQLLDLPREFLSLTSRKTPLQSAGHPLAPAWRATGSPTSLSQEVTVRRGGEEDGRRESGRGLLCWYPSLSASPRWSYTDHPLFHQTADQERGCAYTVPVANLCLNIVCHIPWTRLVSELGAGCWNGPNRATFTKISVPAEPPK